MRIAKPAFAFLLTLSVLVLSATAGRAIEAVHVSGKERVIELTLMAERGPAGDIIQISTAPDREGTIRRIVVKAVKSGSRPGWIVFVLTNDSGKPIERLLVAPYARQPGSGVRRIAAITASQGPRPDREDETDADAFTLTLDPGSTITFVAELGSMNLPRLYLWAPGAYKNARNGPALRRDAGPGEGRAD